MNGARTRPTLPSIPQKVESFPFMSTRKEWDPVAMNWFAKSWTPPCLRVPVAASDLHSLTRFVGTIEGELSRCGSLRALLIRVPEPHSRPKDSCDLDLPVWDLEEAKVFHANPQVWVHVDYTRYRAAYKRVHPQLDLSEYVIDHIENRRRARFLGWQYLRLCHVTRTVNSSSGKASEQMGVDFAPTVVYRESMGWGNIRYADVADLAKILGFRMGGVPMEGLEDVLHLFEPRAGRKHRGSCCCNN